MKNKTSEDDKIERRGGVVKMNGMNKIRWNSFSKDR